MDDFREGRINTSGKEAFKAIERLQDTVLYLSIGMNYSEYMKYLEIAGYVYFTMDGTAHSSNIKEDIFPNEAEFVIMYCTDSRLKLKT